MHEYDIDNLIHDIVKTGLCTGCGTCIGICPANAIGFDFALEEPYLEGNCTGCGLCYVTCPGQDIPLPEMETKFLGQYRGKKEELLGVSYSYLKGYANDPVIRKLGSSGGVTTALLVFALERQLIDAAIITTMNPKKPWRAHPMVAKTREDLIEAAKSKYAICPNNMALKEIGDVKRLAVVGLPCHVHGIRKLQSEEALSELAGKIVIVLGLFCGSNWPHQATERMIREYSDIDLEDILHFEYRGGEEAQDVKIITHSNEEHIITMAERRMVFQCMEKDRCLVCCDWSAEVADLSLGDIFDPRLRGNVRKVPNWNSIIIRSQSGKRLIDEALKADVINLSPLEKESFYGNIGFELKKTGAVYRLQDRKRHDWPVPNYHINFTWPAIRKQNYPVPEN